MNMRNTAGKLGFIKDSEGVYRKGNFVFKNGKIMRESQIVPEGTIEDVADNYTTLGECIRAILAFSTTLGELPRTSDVYIDKVGNNYKPAKKFSKNTVAVVTSQRQVIEVKAKDITQQDDTKVLANKKDKPVNPKEIKDFSRPTEFSKLKKESAKLKESEFTEDDNPIEILEAIYTQYEEMNMTNSFFDDLLNHTDLSIKDLIEWYEMGE